MNDIENDYIPLELPNILFEIPKSRASSATAENTKTASMLFPLIKRLAEARPRWKFVSNRRWPGNVGGEHTVPHFRVYEGNTHLGSIWKTYHSRGDVICIDNERMADARVRGAYTSTTNVQKAFKLVVKNFRGPSIGELVKEAVSQSRDAVETLAFMNRKTFERKFEAMNAFVVAYTMNNWGHMKQTAIDVGISPTSLDGMEEAYAALRATREINNAMGGTEGATVLIRGDEYIVVINGIVSIFDTDHLPPHIKRAVGILKMVGVNEYVEGQGARVGKDKFFVSANQGAAS